jgi:hypothetical protein
VQSVSVLQDKWFSVPAHAAMSMVGSQVVTDARCAFPFDSTIHPVFDEITGIPGSEGSTGSFVATVEETGAMVTTDVDSPDGDEVWEAPAQP